jgi:hypothetical protein
MSFGAGAAKWRKNNIATFSKQYNAIYPQKEYPNM